MTISAQFEQKLENFIKGELITRLDEFIQFSLQESDKGNQEAPVSWDDFQNLYILPEYFGNYVNFSGGFEGDRQIEENRLEELQSTYEMDSTEWDEIQFELDELNDLEFRQQEIFEFWLTSRALFNDLQRKGEPVAESSNGYIWGRTTTGQSPIVDGVIQRIYQEL